MSGEGSDPFRGEIDTTGRPISPGAIPFYRATKRARDADGVKSHGRKKASSPIQMTTLFGRHDSTAERVLTDNTTVPGTRATALNKWRQRHEVPERTKKSRSSSLAPATACEAVTTPRRPVLDRLGPMPRWTTVFKSRGARAETNENAGAAGRDRTADPLITNQRLGYFGRLMGFAGNCGRQTKPANTGLK